MNIDEVPSADYQDRLVTGNEAAKLLGISGGRWRQLVGDRGELDPILGSPIVTKGQRGGRWPMQAVLQYAMARKRTLGVQLPPLLPRGDGHRRYVSASGVVWNAPKGVTLTVDRIGPVYGAKAWAEFLLPESDVLCGQQVPPLLVLTPLWPSEQHDILQALPILVNEASRVPGWEIPPRGKQIMSVAIVPDGGSSVGLLLSTMVWVCQMPVPVFNPAKSHGWFTVPGQPVVSQVPPSALAACLGLGKLPWWPEGCATSVTCSLWRPGAPVPLAVPESLVPRHQAALWLCDQSAEMADTQRAQGYRALAVAVDITGSERDCIDDRSVPSGYELGVAMTWPSEIEAPIGLDIMVWLDQVLGSPATPPDVGETLTDWFGDPSFAHPEQIRLRDLPDDWRQAIVDGYDEDVSGLHPRRLRLMDYCDGRVGKAILFGPMRAPAYLGDDELVWLPPTGFAPESGACILSTVVSSGARDVLLARTAEGRVRGWYRTANGHASPLPAKSQWCVGENGDVRILYALLTGRSIHEVFNLNGFQNDDLQRLTALFRTVEAGSPVSLTWGNLLSLVRL